MESKPCDPHRKFMLVIFKAKSLQKLASLLALRGWLQRTLQGRVSDTELSDTRLDDFIGNKAKVTVAISPDSTDGRVDFRGTQWAASAKVAISAEATVRIVSKDNLTLRVEPI